MKITDSNVWQRLVLKYYIPTKKYRQNTIEIHFVNLKDPKKAIIFLKQILMAGVTGLEPATSCVTGRRSNQTELHPQILVGSKGLEPLTPSV